MLLKGIEFRNTIMNYMQKISGTDVDKKQHD